MGGRALKTTETRRYEKQEFFDLWPILKDKVEKAFNTEAELVISYHDKDSFGDMDIIVLNDGNMPTPEEIKRILTEDFGASEIHQNSTIYSFDFNELQIDLIFTPTSNWETSQVFFAYNDLGNLMGKIFHKLCLSYGFEGLRYIYRMDGGERILGSFIVSKDSQKIFEFIGLDWAHFQKGFFNVQEIFEYIESSPYFVPESFYYENLDQKNRKRNKKRANYALFIEYINKKYKKDESKLQVGKYKHGKDKDQYKQIIHDYFPEVDFNKRLKEFEEKAAYKQVIASKYNGRIIMELIPGLSGKELGKFIGDHAEFVGKAGYMSLDEIVYNAEQEDINEMILEFHKDWGK